MGKVMIYVSLSFLPRGLSLSLARSLALSLSLSLSPALSPLFTPLYDVSGKIVSAAVELHFIFVIIYLLVEKKYLFFIFFNLNI